MPNRLSVQLPDSRINTLNNKERMQVISDEADMFCKVNMHALRTYVYDSHHIFLHTLRGLYYCYYRKV